MSRKWSYELAVPNDVVEGGELDGYRELAVSTWHTAAEASGGMPGEPEVELVDIPAGSGRPDPVTGETPTRAWRVWGPVV